MRPILGITMGDPCGIGPEITARALARADVAAACRPLVVGSAKVFEKAVRLVGAGLGVHAVQSAAEAEFRDGVIDVLDQDLIDAETMTPGVVDPAAGNAAFQAVKKVIELAMAGDVHATVTGPLNKEAMNLAGWHYGGHTEIFADLTGTKRYAMMLADEHLKVVHVSTHVSLRAACERCKKDRVLEVIRLARAACVSLGIQAPRVAVAGLNPHAGENGLFGREEIEEIAPAVALARGEGIDAEGPLPPDTVFSKAVGGMYDVVVAQYHDQGHIPMKVLGFRLDRESGKWQSVSGVNITLGLPIIRASVDHGTAFDQAWKGTASSDSLVNAIEYAVRLAAGAQRTEGGGEA
ncbi:MAG TPA: 4-hydroxythreonine-4-phosphate dehydrogenase PdxA [Candidatus Limnocylindria bacterium]|nr:4-hydroxythreonine-4-phosphate dehydrogenase PdxA [Candidatus Limnocylindria bacterium]